MTEKKILNVQNPTKNELDIFFFGFGDMTILFAVFPNMVSFRKNANILTIEHKNVNFRTCMDSHKYFMNYSIQPPSR